jgi:hypothetical protein
MNEDLRLDLFLIDATMISVGLTIFLMYYPVTTIVGLIIAAPLVAIWIKNDR